MSRSRGSFARRLTGVAATVIVFAGMVWGGASGALAAPRAAKTAQIRYAIGKPACKAPKHQGIAQCFAMRRVFVKAGTPGAHRVKANVAPSPGPSGGLTPAELASAYGYSTAGGVGTTVAIVDAFNDPNIEADLQTFDTKYGLSTCTKANGCLRVVSQTGSTTALPPNDTTGWSAEEALDVETVRAVCPNCKILLVETTSASYANLAAGVNEAVALGAKIISNSYGGPESGMPSTYRAAYDHPGVVITASTGDNGWFNWDTVNKGGVSANMPNAPASLNTVVAVGGTSLFLSQSGSRASETVWNNDGQADFYGSQISNLTGASGGGCSTLFTAQPWQSNVPGFAATTCGHQRLNADIAAVADPLTGFDIYDSFTCASGCVPGAGWYTYGGTSLAAPLVAAMWALAGGAAGVNYPSLYPYGHLADATKSLYDVTVGGNGYCDGLAVGQCNGGLSGPSNPNSYGFGMIDCDYADTAQPGTPSTGVAQCDAAPGYDGPTGVGTPIGLNALKPASFAVITVPGFLPVGSSALFSGALSKDPYPNGAVTGYTWSWGDGTKNSTGIAATHTYAAGTWTITLREVEKYGAISTTTARVTLGAKPTAVLTAPSTVTHGVAASFGGGHSTDTNTGGKITSYSWTWGDGTTTKTASTDVTHTYALAGSRTVTLTVTDNYGNVSAPVSRTIKVG
jgi:PKD domain-containing protein